MSLTKPRYMLPYKKRRTVS